jgi:hypothetical protein
VSSHHFVREGQEPALFIAEDASYADVAPLLEWSPYVMVVDAQLEKILSWGIRVDAVVTMYDRRDRIRDVLSELQEVELVIARTHEDVIVQGMNFLISRGQENVNVFVTSMEKFSLEFADLLQKIRPVLFEKDWRWVPVRRNFQKWVSRGTRFKLRKADSMKPIQLDGVIAEDGVYVASRDGIISFSGPELIWIGEFYQNK